LKTSPEIRIYISCALGLESALSKEAALLGIDLKSSKTVESSAFSQISGEEKGGFEFTGNLEQVYTCNLHLRTASRVVVRLGEFYAAAFSELRKKASRLDWDQYINPGQPVEVKVTCHKSRLYHSDAVAERVLGAIEDHFKQPTKIIEKDAPKQLILVRLVNDLCTISIDSSGELLHRRGYRQAVAKAPIRETLAAGLLLSAGWDGKSPLVDPFCGSGTIPIEGALISRQISPGINRSFSFTSWPVFDETSYQAMLAQARAEILPASISIYASDRDKGAVEMASANAARTGVFKDIQFACHAISDLPGFPVPGWLVTNPPYGVRLSPNKDLRNLYASFGKLLREKYSGWKIGILCSEDPLIGSLELGQPVQAITLINGGIPVKFSQYLIS